MKIFFLIFIILFSVTAGADEVALTFDDLPCADEINIVQELAINRNILDALANFKAPAIGFVNEGKLYKRNEFGQQVKILELWLEYGHMLGNHSYSHQALSKIPLEDFENDVLKGAKISEKLMRKRGFNYKYFRYPYNDTGSNEKMIKNFEAFLKSNNYIVAPMTIDTDDYWFNNQLKKHPDQKDRILKNYLEHTKAKFDFYKHASQKIFGYNIKHVWVLHVNLLNSYVMNDLLALVKEMGYKFISLDQALEDKAYRAPNYYYQSHGVSWLGGIIQKAR